MLCYVEVMFIQLLNLLERYYVFIYICVCLVYLVIKSYKLLIIDNNLIDTTTNQQGWGGVG